MGGAAPLPLPSFKQRSLRRRVPPRREGSPLASFREGQFPSLLALLSPRSSPFLPCTLTLHLRHSHMHLRKGAWAGCARQRCAAGRAWEGTLVLQRERGAGSVPLQPGGVRAARAAAVLHSRQQLLCVVCVCVDGSRCLSCAAPARPRAQRASQCACSARAPARSRLPFHVVAVPQLLLW